MKAVSELYAPVSGLVSEINEKLLDTPELINSSPQEEGEEIFFITNYMCASLSTEREDQI